MTIYTNLDLFVTGSLITIHSAISPYRPKCSLRPSTKWSNILIKMNIYDSIINTHYFIYRYYIMACRCCINK